MLMPSALGCDAAQHTPRRRIQSALFASPPLSPPPSASRPAAVSSLYSTCRALQSMLTPPRGLQKRRRATDGDMARDDAPDEDSEQDAPASCDKGPRTPKRMRFAPEIMPLGLERRDFHKLRREEMESPSPSHDPGATPAGGSSGFALPLGLGREWSAEEDRVLVELVLEKLKLTKGDWQDCARRLGKDRRSVGRRWKSLMGRGEVGLKRNLPRRAKLPEAWR